MSVVKRAETELDTIGEQPADLDTALRRTEQAIAEHPDEAAAHYAHGNQLRRLGRLEEAIASYLRAIDLEPDHEAVHTNVGHVLRQLGRFEESLASHEAALALRPEHPGLHYNRGNALARLKRSEEAIACYERALALRPDFPEATFNWASTSLLLGRLSVGWRGHEARKLRKEKRSGHRKFVKPLWLGETDIAGKTILVHPEQGFGDIIQFSRYVKLLDKAGARVLFAPPIELKTLMRGLGANVRIVDLDPDALFFNCHCPLMSLPLAFRTELDTIPAAPYLSAHEDKVEFWRGKLGSRTRPRIGIVWTGNVQPDKGRSIDLQLFRRLFSARFEFICLQKKVSDAERATLDKAGVAFFGDEFVDFSDTAALCVLMDLVISIDTGVAHLAGALGVPVWVLLPWFADWRWLLDRDDSPWYPSMRLFRQRNRGDWTEVLERVALQLRQMAPA